MKTLKEGLDEYKLEVMYCGREINLFRKALRLTQEGNALWCDEEEETFLGKKHVIFRIRCSTTSFAQAFWTLGINTQIHLLSKRKIKLKNGRQREAKIKSKKTKSTR